MKQIRNARTWPNEELLNRDQGNGKHDIFTHRYNNISEFGPNLIKIPYFFPYILRKTHKHHNPDKGIATEPLMNSTMTLATAQFITESCFCPDELKLSVH